ncbi:hypothetical protein Pan216_28570 [Planctomycetes bacterium Pan216]|uniref:DUF2383 domain-containing protein n=1 Tax=Kolteria novifilia TaxID=2527975 RepID=A0A518B4T1_9BACT|nr:hypothetical protein Pan216_28570 [Planctomycetes bacterium Pan216]
MNVQTKTDLRPETISKLQDLGRINLDSSKGFDDAAEHVKNPHLADLFRELATERRSQLNELNTFIDVNGEDTVVQGSYAAKFHRMWMKFRDSVSSDNAHTILSEAEYGEDQIKEAYEDALKETAGSPMNDVLQKQYAQVKSAHDRVRDLRDTTASK